MQSQQQSRVTHIAMCMLLALALAAIAYLLYGSWKIEKAREWITFGNNGGNSLVHLPDVGIILKEDPDNQRYTVRLVVSGVLIEESFPNPDLRNKRFREISKMLGTMR